MNTDSDSEVLLNVFAQELQKLGKLTANAEDFSLLWLASIVVFAVVMLLLV